jgi:hypothetical protein
MLAYAKKYIALGWHVLPLQPGTKQPLARLVKNGVHGASNDLETITRWWTAEPMAGIGVAVLPSGLVAIDIDPRNGGFETMERLEAQHGPLVSDVLALTGGGGEHRVFYSGLVTGLPGKLGPGVDVKADGYICVEPSLHPNGKAYNWEASSDPTEGCTPSTLPGWVRDLARGPFNAVPFVPASRLVDPKQVADLRQALSTLPADDYAQWVNFGNALVELGQAGFSLWDEWSQKSDKYDAQAVTRKWRSFKAGHYQLESIFFAAQNIGWVNPAGVAPALLEQPTPIVATEKMVQEANEDVDDRVNPVPIELFALPGVMGECMAWMTRTAQRPQPLLSMAATLSLFATALSTKVASPTRLRTNLYLVSVAGTSSGKDHGRKCLAKVLQAARLDHLIGGDDLASGAGLLSRAHKCPRTVFQLDEFGMMLQAMRSKNAGAHLASIVKNLMILFGSTDSIYRGTEYADQKIRQRMDIEYPCINVHATTTGEQFFPALGSADVTSGALNRLLVLVCPDVLVPRQKPASEDPPEGVVKWIEQAQLLQKDMLGLTPASPIVVAYTNEADDLIEKFGVWVDEYRDKAENPQTKALWGRAFEFSIKLALLYAVTQHSDPQALADLVSRGGLRIDANSARWGIAFTKHFMGAMDLELTARMGDSEFDILVKECIRHINRKGKRGLTGAELGRFCPAYGGKEPRIQDAIHIAILRREAAVQVVYPPASGRGKSRNAWVATQFIEAELND